MHVRGWMLACALVVTDLAVASTTVGQDGHAGSLSEATTLTADADRLSDEERYDEALPLAARALAIREKALGPNDLQVADSVNKLAVICHRKGDYAKAEALHLRALDIRRKVLGPQHPDVAQSLNNLAAVYLAVATGRLGSHFHRFHR